MKMKNTQVGGEPWSTLEYADVCQNNFKTILPFLNLKKKQNYSRNPNVSVLRMLQMKICKLLPRQFEISGTMKFMSPAQ